MTRGNMENVQTERNTKKMEHKVMQKNEVKTRCRVLPSRRLGCLPFRLAALASGHLASPPWLPSSAGLIGVKGCTTQQMLRKVARLTKS